MRRFRCHKEVEAGKIVSIYQAPADEAAPAGSGGTWVILVDDERITVPHTFIVKHEPQIGGYLVRYVDGYLSFSPEKAFDDGYTAI